MKIGFIGAGNMAYALAGAITAAFPETELHVSDPNAERRELFNRQFPGCHSGSDNLALCQSADVIFLAVKPQILPSVLPEIGDCRALVISICAGIPLATLRTSLPQARLVRVMPNTPCLVGEMAAGYAVEPDLGPDDAEKARTLLQSAGIALEVPEDLIDAVTGLSGSGPAFFARIFEAFTRAGTQLGLSEENARALTLQTARGTAALLEKRQMGFEELVTMVSSPGGTTVAGRAVLEASDLSEVIDATVTAACKRSRELGA